MLKSLEVIKSYKNGDYQVLQDNKWLEYLVITTEKNVNLEKVKSLKEVNENTVLNYVEKTLELLNNLDSPSFSKQLLEEVLKWSEVAKCGSKEKRQQWLEKGYNLYAHNEGSAQIFLDEHKGNFYYSEEKLQIVATLIKTHGLIGQYIRGEVQLSDSKELLSLSLPKMQRYLMLIDLNYCIMGAVSIELWEKVEDRTIEDIRSLLTEQYEDDSIKDKLRKLRSISIKNGEDFEILYDRFSQNKEVMEKVSAVLSNTLWYVEPALHDFTLTEFFKIMLLVSNGVRNEEIKHISFEHVMKDMYYNYKGEKKINLYKKRIIEDYLRNMTFEDILNEKYYYSPHLGHKSEHIHGIKQTVLFTFNFSTAAEKLIEFCEATELEETDSLYEKAVIMLLDLFGLRRDKYDRFHNEQEYLETMNQSVDYKKVMLDYIVGDKVLDVGPGGGVVLDLIEEELPEKQAIGIDISQNVIEELKKKKNREGKKWNVMYGDALNLKNYIETGEVQTILFSSVIHELFSYIELEGKKFNYDTIVASLKSAFEVVPVGGRIIIRDGIMTESKELKRIIRFHSNEGMKFLKNYVRDFKGREIQYEVVGHNEVLMPVNDAMEFLYTYTWGEDSYTHEVQEQFGYFTPKEYVSFIQNTLGKEAEVVEVRHYLQEGYDTFLSQKVEFFNEKRQSVNLPDSTCLIVIEKK